MTPKEQTLKLTSKTSTTFTFHMVLTEGQMRALDALAGYGDDEFIKVFYEHLGKHYLEPHEKDLRSLFQAIHSMRPHLNVVDKFKKEGEEIANKYQL